jgi:hypothetical protein
MDIYTICDLQGAAEDAIRALQAIKERLDAAIKEHEDRRA